jgi:hypothetical protein
LTGFCRAVKYAQKALRWKRKCAMKSIINAKAKYQKDLSPSEYLNMTDVERSNIKYVKIIPPVIGSKSFGKISVILKSPVYEAVLDE